MTVLANLAAALPGALSVPATRRPGPTDESRDAAFAATLDAALGELDADAVAPAVASAESESRHSARAVDEPATPPVDAIALLLASGPIALPVPPPRVPQATAAAKVQAGVLVQHAAAPLDALRSQPPGAPVPAPSAPAAPADAAALPRDSAALAIAPADACGAGVQGLATDSARPASVPQPVQQDTTPGEPPALAVRMPGAADSGATPANDGHQRAALQTNVPFAAAPAVGAASPGRERAPAREERPATAATAQPGSAALAPVQPAAPGDGRHVQSQDSGAAAADPAWVPAAGGASAAAAPAHARTDPAAAPAAHVAAPVGSDDWAPALAQQLVRLRPGREIELHLHPADLGPLRVTLSLANSQAHVQFASEHIAVRQALETALPQLRASFAESGISLGQATVGSGSGGSHAQQDGEPQRAGLLPESIAPDLPRDGGSTAPRRQPRSAIDTFA